MNVPDREAPKIYSTVLFIDGVFPANLDMDYAYHADCVVIASAVSNFLSMNDMN